MPNKITVIVMETGKDAKVVEIDNTLETFQKLVGGYIETVRLSGGRILICDDEGRFKDLKANRVVDDLRVLRRPITLMGTVVMVRVKGAEFDSVQDGDLDWINAHSKRWELINE